MNVINRQRTFYSIWICIFALLLSCSGGGDDPPPNTNPTPDPETVTVSGTVSDSGGLSGVSVSSGTLSTTTDDNGYYSLSGIPVPATNRVILTFEKAGYATYQKSLVVGGAASYTIAANLMQHHFNEVVNPGVDNNLIIANPENVTGPPLARLSLPTNSVQSTSDVTVSVAVGDPTTEKGRSIFPGDYMAAADATSEPDILLESVAFTEVTLKNSIGEEVTLDSNNPAQLTVKLPDEFQTGGAKAGTYDPVDPSKNTIPWWSYNENNGAWVREDADPSTTELDNAQVIDDNGVLYAQAKVTHFSWWNVDQPITTHACLCLTVVDQDGNPLAGAMVIAEGVSYNGVSAPKVTDANGRACVNVKKVRPLFKRQ